MKNWVKAMAYVFVGFALLAGFIVACYYIEWLRWLPICGAWVVVAFLLVYSVKKLLDDEDEFR